MTETPAELFAELVDLFEDPAAADEVLDLYAAELAAASLELATDRTVGGAIEPSLAATVHKLKGASYSVGMNSIGVLCETVEGALRAGTDTDPAVAALRASAAAYLTQLRRFLDTRPAN